MAGWHHWCNGHELGQASGDGKGQGSLACCSPQGHKVSDTTGQLDNNYWWTPRMMRVWHQPRYSISVGWMTEQMMSMKVISKYKMRHKSFSSAYHALQYTALQGIVYYRWQDRPFHILADYKAQVSVFLIVTLSFALSPSKIMAFSTSLLLPQHFWCPHATLSPTHSTAEQGHTQLGGSLEQETFPAINAPSAIEFQFFQLAFPAWQGHLLFGFWGRTHSETQVSWVPTLHQELLLM